MLINIHLPPLPLGLQEERWQGGEKAVRCRQRSCSWHPWWLALVIHHCVLSNFMAMGSAVVQKPWEFIPFSPWHHLACPEDPTSSTLLGCALSGPRSPVQIRSHCFPLPSRIQQGPQPSPVRQHVQVHNGCLETTVTYQLLCGSCNLISASPIARGHGRAHLHSPWACTKETWHQKFPSKQ